MVGFFVVAVVCAFVCFWQGSLGNVICRSQKKEKKDFDNSEASQLLKLGHEILPFLN